ncbi:hypothetical protein A2982_00300 [candidate division WWE3 bacterium RIFCSPLOWO2_01_FULL_39_13]|uniref:30S ribosomal protein S21 n=1 Tax=candidate division WWE3 bacterium RIFCSPLOWO2_01_FULL_39_13 TaxID=1802624 RepID=A0A1F4V4C8_UNCKA|nr:MAG: hypothetical protein A2982_00300 [candidate division WWE3 bacterium RIFCSPLOWO2_01_FULL_39_13]
MAAKGAEINLKESKMSVEQALRELKNMVEEDMQILTDNRYYVKPTKQRREREKRRKASIRKYNKYN